MLPDVEGALVDAQSLSQLPFPTIWATDRDLCLTLRSVPHVELHAGAAEINSKWHYTTLPRGQSRTRLWIMVAPFLA